MPPRCANSTGLKAVALERDSFVYKRHLFVFTICLLVAAYNKTLVYFYEDTPMMAVTGEWRRLHKEELNDVYSSPNVVRVIKSRRL